MSTRYLDHPSDCRCNDCFEWRGELIETLTNERTNWRDTAERHCRNEKFYHGIVTAIGELFGTPAKTSDDESLQQEVLALKVHALVVDLVEKAGTGIPVLESVKRYNPELDWCDGLNCAGVVKDAEGDFVTFSDFQKLTKENEDIKTAIVDLIEKYATN